MKPAQLETIALPFTHDEGTLPYGADEGVTPFGEFVPATIDIMQAFQLGGLANHNMIASSGAHNGEEGDGTGGPRKDPPLMIGSLPPNGGDILSLN